MGVCNEQLEGWGAEQTGRERAGEVDGSLVHHNGGVHVWSSNV